MSSGNDKFLPTTTYAVLGLLSFGGELSGYQLRQIALGSLRFFYWTPAQSQIYRELRRLEELGFATGTAVEQDRRPDKITYTITPAGHKELTRWLEHAPLSPPVIKFDAALRLFLGHATTIQRLLEIVDEQRQHLQAALAELEMVRAALGNNPTLARQRIVADWGQHFYTHELQELDRTEQELREIPDHAGEIQLPDPDEVGL
jgi:DNA-binding PadR family transcriptional regulator